MTDLLPSLRTSNWQSLSSNISAEFLLYSNMWIHTFTCKALTKGWDSGLYLCRGCGCQPRSWGESIPHVTVPAGWGGGCCFDDESRLLFCRVDGALGLGNVASVGGSHCFGTCRGPLLEEQHAVRGNGDAHDRDRMARAEDSDGIIHFLRVALVVSEHREVKIYSYVVEIHSDPHKKPQQPRQNQVVPSPASCRNARCSSEKKPRAGNSCPAARRSSMQRKQKLCLLHLCSLWSSKGSSSRSSTFRQRTTPWAPLILPSLANIDILAFVGAM